jgi:hypothetical protein
VNLFLSALVLAWGLAPPGIRHGHEGGEDRSHRHNGGANDEDHNDGRVLLANGDSRQVGSERSPVVLCSLVVHLHWSLLGVDFSVPVSDGDRSDNGSSSGDPVVVRLVDSVPTPALERDRSVNCDSVTVQHSGLAADVDQASSLTPVGPTPSAPLCDRARHERSGVLLI